MTKRRRGKGEGSIFQRKDGRWQGAVTVGYNLDGTQKRKTVYGKSFEDVRSKIDQLKGQFLSGAFCDTRLTVDAYLSQWLDYKALEVKPRSHQFYDDYIRLYLKPQLGRLKLASLTPLHIQAMMQTVAKATSPDAANKSRTVLNVALRQAVKLELITRNPIDAVDKLKYEPKDPSLWTLEQIKRFLAYAKPHRLYAAFYLALSTGMRHGEVLGVRWQDIRGDILTVRQAVINIRGAQYAISTPKTRKGIRRIVLGPDSKILLNEHNSRQAAERQYLGESWVNSDLVFTNEYGDVLLPRNFDRVWYELQDKAEVPRTRFHNLRHLHVSLLIKAGMDPRTVADRVGHTDPSFTLKRYSHMFEGQRRAAALPLTELLELATDEDEDLSEG